MNLTLLHQDCKKYARIVFENFKNSVVNYPLENIITEEVIEEIIEFEIKQQFGRKVLKNHVTGNESDVQLKKMQEIVSDYKETIIKTCWNWWRKNC